MRYDRGLIIIVLLLAGCDRFTTQNTDERRIAMDCEMTTPEGAVIRCKHELKKDIDEAGDEIHIKGGRM